MKKIVTLSLVFILILGLAACGGGTNEPQRGEITWYGLEDQRVTAGDRVDLKQNLSVVDTVDGDITDQVVILNDTDNRDELLSLGWLEEYTSFDSNLPGSYNVFYKVENSTGVVDYQRRVFLVVKGHNVINGDFSARLLGWEFHNPGGAATIAVNDNNEAKVTITNPGTEWWAIQLFQTVELKKDVTYKVTVVAKSPTRKAISFSFENIPDNYRMLMGGIVAQKTTEDFSEYVVYYTAADDYLTAKAVLYLGYQLEDDMIMNNQPQEIIIKSIYIETVDICPEVQFTVPAKTTLRYGDFTVDPDDKSGKQYIDIMQGVSATVEGEDVTDMIKVSGQITPYIMGRTNFIINYYIERPNRKVATAYRTFTVEFERSQPYEIINSDFSGGLAAWTIDVNKTAGTGDANFTPVQDGMQITILKRSSANWHIMLFQSGLVFTNEHTYLIKVRLKAENMGSQNKFNFEVSNNSGSGFTPVINLAQNATLTSDFTEYVIEFSPEVNYNNARIALLLGTVAAGTVITVDYFTVEVMN